MIRTLEYFSSPFLNEEWKMETIRKHLLLYIGNKRRIIPYIDRIIYQIQQDDKSVKTFLDMFSGSGVVSKYAKLNGFKVISNDLEKYTTPFNFTYIKSNSEDIDAYFDGKYKETIDYLNTLMVPNKQYFSLHYAPKNTKEPEDTERLYFTQENAAIIDSVLEYVNGNCNENQKMVILANLLHKMSININSCGMMISFNKEFRTDKDRRSIETIKLDYQPFIDGIRGDYYNDYAEKLFETYSLPDQDIVYIDPPYTDRQYSSYYHLLSTAFFNDFYIPESKTGVRSGNKSDFCLKNKCRDAFNVLLSTIKGKYIIISYNDNSLIEISEFIEIIKSHYKFVQPHKFLHSKYNGKYLKDTELKTHEYLIYASNCAELRHYDTWSL